MQTDGIEEIDSIVKGLRKELTDECLELKREIEIIQVLFVRLLVIHAWDEYRSVSVKQWITVSQELQQ